MERQNQRGALYREGLRAIQQKFKVSLEEALRIALEDLEATKSTEHIEPTKAAYALLKSEETE